LNLQVNVRPRRFAIAATKSRLVNAKAHTEELSSDRKEI
jgi:hypothetical protein